MKLRIDWQVVWASRDERVCEDCDNGEDEDVDHFNYIAVCICSRIEMNRVMKGGWWKDGRR